jgi:hypothetical protein
MSDLYPLVVDFFLALSNLGEKKGSTTVMSVAICTTEARFYFGPMFLSVPFECIFSIFGSRAEIGIVVTWVELVI